MAQEKIDGFRWLKLLHSYGIVVAHVVEWCEPQEKRSCLQKQTYNHRVLPQTDGNPQEETAQIAKHDQSWIRRMGL